jgi:hypothetical protein
MPSFNIVQVAYGTGGVDEGTTITFTNPTTEGNTIVAFFGGGQPYGGSVALPSSVNYNPPNIDPVDLTLLDNDLQANEAIDGIYFINNILGGATTIAYNGGTFYPYGPSMIAIEISTPENFLAIGLHGNPSVAGYGSGQLATGSTGGVGIALGLTGTNTRTGPQSLTFGAVNEGTYILTTAILLINPGIDIMFIVGAYDKSSSHTLSGNVPWTSSGTIIAETYELNPGAGGMSAVLAYSNFNYLVGDGCSGGTPVFSISCNNPPNAQVGQSYSHLFPVTGSNPPFTWSITAGSLPPGLSLNSSTGYVTGTATTAGAYWFTITATDSDDNTVSTTCAIGVCAGGGGNLAFYSRH